MSGALSNKTQGAMHSSKSHACMQESSYHSQFSIPLAQGEFSPWLPHALHQPLLVLTSVSG